jgi:ubiquitin carboxyl-terminal hydrolase L3
MNGSAASSIVPGSTVARLRAAALNPELTTLERAKLLEDSDELERAHAAAAVRGQTEAPSLEEADRDGNHFIAFLESDGRLWELEGNRPGPIDRGPVGEAGLGAQVLKYVKLAEESGEGGGLFSCLALVGEA